MYLSSGDPAKADLAEQIAAAVNEFGLATAERYGLSIHDAMIVASALQADCGTLWSEDMHDGLVIEDRLRIAHPFHAR